MVTVLKCTTEEQRSVVRFLWTEGLNAKDIRKEMFHVYGGKCLSLKAVHIWATNVSLVTKRLKRRCGSGWDNNQNLCCGFWRTGKAMGQAYQCRWRIFREINVFFFQIRISHVLRFICIYDLFTDSPSYSAITSNKGCILLSLFSNFRLI
jgi:hypothetical protein